LVTDDDLDKLFKDEVNKRLGMKRENSEIAIEKAMKMWTEMNV